MEIVIKSFTIEVLASKIRERAIARNLARRRNVSAVRPQWQPLARSELKIG